MSSELHKSVGPAAPLPKVAGMRVGIAVAEWNSHVTGALLKGAIETLKAEGYPDDCATVYHVPGTVELTFAAARMAKSGKFDAVIVLGCVIRGDTPHFDYVCDSVTQGVAQLNATGGVPVIFGVLTTENEAQALDRAGGSVGNKGAEAAEAAIKMCDFALKFR